MASHPPSHHDINIKEAQRTPDQRTRRGRIMWRAAGDTNKQHGRKSRKTQCKTNLCTSVELPTQESMHKVLSRSLPPRSHHRRTVPAFSARSRTRSLAKSPACDQARVQQMLAHTRTSPSPPQTRDCGAPIACVTFMSLSARCGSMCARLRKRVAIALTDGKNAEPSAWASCTARLFESSG